jgi:L-rhamnose-H+ transport protein
MDFLIGVALVIVSGAMLGLFTLPVPRTPRWQWENIWGLGSLVALLLVPWPVAWATVPNLREVYGSVTPGVLMLTLVLGFGWGLGGILLGKGVAVVGIAMGTSLVMGLVNVFGSPVLLAITRGPEKLLEPGGKALLAAVAVMVLGVAICALAAARKEREISGQSCSSTGAKTSTPFVVGLVICILSAVLSSLVNFSFVYGEPIKQAALRADALPAAAPNAIWALVFTSNYLINAGYAFYLMFRNRTAGLIMSQGSAGYGLWVLFMGMAWPLSIVLYGMGADRMGVYGAYVAFPMMLVMAILFGNMAGAITGEWRGAFPETKATMVVGVMVLVAAFALFGVASRLLANQDTSKCLCLAVVLHQAIRDEAVVLPTRPGVLIGVGRQGPQWRDAETNKLMRVVIERSEGDCHLRMEVRV